MSLFSAQNGLAQNVQTSQTTVNTASGATGTAVTNTITGSTITISPNTATTLGSQITIPYVGGVQTIGSSGQTWIVQGTGGAGG